MELIVKTHSVDADHLHGQDGDIVVAFSNRAIHCCHAEMICHPDNFSFNSYGLRDRDTLLEKYMRKISKFKFTRLNSNDVQRLNLSTGEEDILNTIPNSKKEYMNVYMYLARRLKHHRHKIFGVSHGNEVWYGGRVSVDVPIVESVWADIETHTDNLKDNHSYWPFTDLEKRRFLPLNCVGYKFNRQSWTSEFKEISDGTVEDQARPIERVEEDRKITKIADRKCCVPYWDLASQLGIDVDDVRNKDKELDARSDAQVSERNKMDDIIVDKVEAGIIVL